MWWILLSTINAVHNVDSFMVKSARSMGATQLDILRKVVLPITLPSIFTGLRIAYTDVILMLFAIEMLGTEKGLGSIIINGNCHSGPENVMVYSISMFMAIIGLIANFSLVAVERRPCTWKEEILLE